MANGSVFGQLAASKVPSMEVDTEMKVELDAKDGLVCVSYMADDGTLRWDAWMTIDEARAVMVAIAEQINRAVEQLS